MTIKGSIDTLTSNPIGALVGAAALYFGAKKFMKVEKQMYLIGLAVVGAVVGSVAQAKMKSKTSVKPAILSVK